MSGKQLTFCSPTYGKIELNEVFELIRSFIDADPTQEYELVVGADSQNFTNHTKFVLVVAVHRKGKGGIFFYSLDYLEYCKNLQKKIHQEVQMSIEVALLLIEKVQKWDYTNLVFNHVDIDIGENGKTKEMIREVVGWVNGVLGIYNIHARIKPFAPVASCIADKLSK